MPEDIELIEAPPAGANEYTVIPVGDNHQEFMMWSKRLLNQVAFNLRTKNSIAPEWLTDDVKQAAADNGYNIKMMPAPASSGESETGHVWVYFLRIAEQGKPTAPQRV